MTKTKPTMLLSHVRPLLALLSISSFSLLVPTTFALVSNAPQSPQNLTQVICADRVDGRAECEVELDVPSACVGVEGGESSCPIVFFLHGAGGSNNGFSRRSGVHSAQVIGVYPNGENGWNTGPKSSNVCGWKDFDCTSDPDEGDYIASIISEVRSMGALGNIYVIGSSNGAALAHRLASNAGDDLPIKGIVATVTQLLASPERSGPGTLNYNQPSISAERTTPAVSVLSVMGTADGLIPYDGGSSSVFGGDENFQLMPALDSMFFWATHNGCTGANTPTTSTHTTDMGTGTATKYEYTGCPDGVFVEHYAIEGGGHNSGNGEIDGEKVKYAWAYEFISRVEAGGGGGGPPVSSPVAAPSPITSCVDDPTWAGKFNVDHTCDYVALKPDRRCNWENSDGVKANIACPLACDPDCTSSPVASPSSAPVVSPVASPTTPQAECTNDDTWAGKMNVAHTCDYVALKPERRCNWENSDGVKANVACPLACLTECRDSGSPCTKDIFCHSGECKADGACL